MKKLRLKLLTNEETSNEEQYHKDLTPTQIVKELDKYIIGQDDAKRAVAIALRNRWRRRQVDESIAKKLCRTILY